MDDSSGIGSALGLFLGTADWPAALLRRPSDPPPAVSAPLNRFWQFCAVALAYHLACRIGLLFVPQALGDTIFWPASGLLLGLLLVTRRETWWITLAGAGAGNLSACLILGYPLAIMLGFTTAHLLESILGAILVERIGHRRAGLNGPHEVFVLYLVPILGACSIAAGFCAAAATWELGSAFWSGWLFQWLSHSLGVILVAPLIIAAATNWSLHRSLPVFNRFTWKYCLEVATQLSGLVIFSLLIHGAPLSRQHILLHRPFFILPLLLWAAIRFGPRGTSLSVLLVAVSAIAGVVHGTGPFAATSAPVPLQVLTVLAFAWVGSLSFMVLAVCIAQLKHREAQLREDDEALRRYAHDVEQARDRIERQAQELVAQAESLKSARQAAEAANLAKSQFLATMSHEIRTPMTAILGYAELLRDETNPQRCHEAAEIIQRNGDHLLVLINDILDISKIEAGKFSTQQLRVSPGELVNEVLDLMRVRALGKNLKLEASFDTPIPRTILSDPLRLRQILVNLVGNAIKFTRQGVVRVGVSFQQQEGMCFAVTDTGIGMSDEQIQGIFRPFTQADPSTTRRFGGTGLGLSISQRLAAMLGGHISVVSRPQVGSTFTLTVATGPLDQIPLTEYTAKQGNCPTDAVSECGTSESPVTNLAGSRILLAEDGPDNQRLIAHVLRKAGAAVTVVENGRQAVEICTLDNSLDGHLDPNPPFDLLLMDMQMPEMDGYTAVGLLRHKGSRLPVVALTANAMPEERQRCLAAGCDDYATKPIQRAALLKQLTDWAQPRQQRQRATKESLLLPS